MNPYRNKWHRAILSAWERRMWGPEENPERAARIKRRFSRVFAWATAVEETGIPSEGSFWVRKATCRVWQVLYTERGDLLRIRATGAQETELHHVEDFLQIFYPEGEPQPVKCAACEGDVTFPHEH